MNSISKLGWLLVLTAGSTISLSAQLVNDGRSTGNLIKLSNANGVNDAESGLSTTQLATPSGTNDVLVAEQIVEGFPFFSLRSVWYAIDQSPTNGAYSVSSDFLPALAAPERRGGVMGWLNLSVSNGISFHVRPAGVGASFRVSLVNFLADNGADNESVARLYNLDGTPAAADVNSAWSDLGNYNPTNFATFRLSFSAPSTNELSALSNATAHVTARVFQTGTSNSPVQVGRTIELLTDLAIPSPKDHRIGYYAYWGAISDVGTIGYLDNLTASGQIDVVPNVPPTVRLTEPADGSTFRAPTNITFVAEATDSDGNIARVDFLAGTTLIGIATNSPYTLTWTNPPGGTYALTARATDSRGATTESTNQVRVTVFANFLPTVRVSSPTNGDIFVEPATITVAAEANDRDGSVSRVDFFADALLIGTRTNAPYSITWSNVLVGNYSLIAKATDDRGESDTSTNTVLISVRTNLPPTVRITTPSNAANFNAPASIRILVDSSDADGRVISVECFAGTQLIGTVVSSGAGITTSSFDFNLVPVGNYVLTAKATDNRGASTTSGPVNIRVNVPGEGPPTLMIAQSNNSVVLTWPIDFVGFTLETSTNMTAGSWTSVTADNNRAVVQLSGAAQFYRLVKR